MKQLVIGGLLVAAWTGVIQGDATMVGVPSHGDAGSSGSGSSSGSSASSSGASSSGSSGSASSTGGSGSASSSSGGEAVQGAAVAFRPTWSRFCKRLAFHAILRRLSEGRRWLF